MASLLHNKIQHSFYGSQGHMINFSVTSYTSFPTTLPHDYLHSNQNWPPCCSSNMAGTLFCTYCSLCLVMMYHHPQQSLKTCPLTSFRSFTKGHHPNESFPGHSQISTPPSTYTQPHFYFIFSFPTLLFSPQDLALSYLYFTSIYIHTHTLSNFLFYWLSPLPEWMTQEGKEFYLFCSLLYPQNLK